MASTHMPKQIVPGNILEALTPLASNGYFSIQICNAVPTSQVRRHSIAVDYFLAGLPGGIHPSTAPAKSASVVLECGNFRAEGTKNVTGIRTSWRV